MRGVLPVGIACCLLLVFRRYAQFGAAGTTAPTPADGTRSCRMKGTGGAYGRIEATETTLTYTRVANNAGRVTDSWTITQHNHGPFPDMM